MKSGHDLLAWRLAAILQKLNNGERLEVDDLAAEFNVHRRTILRDLNERFAFLPIEKEDGLFALQPAYLGRITFHDIQHFANLAGLSGLFPQLDPQFFRDLFDARLQESLAIHGHAYENLQAKTQDFRQLQQAISKHQTVRFDYHKAEGTKTVEANPYRLINNGGIWYLAATDNDQPKSYALAKISNLMLQTNPFTPDAKIQHLLDDEDSIWLNQKKTEVVLTIAPQAAPYFKRRKLIAKQVIEKELEDGGIIVSGMFAHANQVLPIVRYWIPHVRIVSPAGWQSELEEKLKDYLQQRH